MSHLGEVPDRAEGGRTESKRPLLLGEGQGDYLKSGLNQGEVRPAQKLS